MEQIDGAVLAAGKVLHQRFEVGLLAAAGDHLTADVGFAQALVGDPQNLFIISGNGDVIEPEFDAIAIGSGGPFAQAAARALTENTELDARTIVERALGIAADICIYTNETIIYEELG